MTFCPAYEIGTTTTLLKPVGWYGIPIPSSHGYNPVGIVKQVGDMMLKGYGFPSATWRWNTMTQAQIWNLLSLFTNDTDMSVRLYIDTYKDTGYESEVATFYCILARPLDGQGKALMPGTANHWNNVAVQFIHLEEQ